VVVLALTPVFAAAAVCAVAAVVVVIAAWVLWTRARWERAWMGRARVRRRRRRTRLRGTREAGLGALGFLVTRQLRRRLRFAVPVFVAAAAAAEHDSEEALVCHFFWVSRGARFCRLGVFFFLSPVGRQAFCVLIFEVFFSALFATARRRG